MRNELSEAGRGVRRFRAKWGAALCLSVFLAVATVNVNVASADDYDASMAGHPLRIIAYILHPVGVVLDYLIMRPAHWLASHEPIQTLVGHED